MNAVADQVAVAGQAGRTVQVGREAYGQLCTIVPLMVNTLQDIILDAIDTAVGSLHETADRLLTVAASYQETDDTAADTIQRAEGGR